MLAFGYPSRAWALRMMSTSRTWSARRFITICLRSGSAMSSRSSGRSRSVNRLEVSHRRWASLPGVTLLPERKKVDRSAEFAGVLLDEAEDAVVDRLGRQGAVDAPLP